MAKVRAHVVYLCYDEDGRLLYVGMSSSPLDRFDQHGATSGWFAQVATIRVIHCSSRYDAHVKELGLIHEHRPPHNHVGTEVPTQPLIPEGRYRRTHCLRGHPFDTTNTWIARNGSRICKACARERRRRVA